MVFKLLKRRPGQTGLVSKIVIICQIVRSSGRQHSWAWVGQATAKLWTIFASDCLKDK